MEVTSLTGLQKACLKQAFRSGYIAAITAQILALHHTAGLSDAAAAASGRRALKRLCTLKFLVEYKKTKRILVYGVSARGAAFLRLQLGVANAAPTLTSASAACHVVHRLISDAISLLIFFKSDTECVEYEGKSEGLGFKSEREVLTDTGYLKADLGKQPDGVVSFGNRALLLETDSVRRSKPDMYKIAAFISSLPSIHPQARVFPLRLLWVCPESGGVHKAYDKKLADLGFKARSYVGDPGVYFTEKSDQFIVVLLPFDFTQPSTGWLPSLRVIASHPYVSFF